MQVLDVKGDWTARRPDRAARRLGVPIRQPALSRRRRHRGRGDGDGSRAEPAPGTRFRPAIARARNGSSACRARTAAGARSMPTTNIYYLNNIPFADHGALLDPPTEDVTARCVSMLAQLGETRRAATGGQARRRLSAPHAARGRQLVRPLGHELHLRHLVGAVRAQCRRRRSRRAGDAQGRATGSSRIQNADGGWGEDGASYKLDYRGYERAPSTASQTAWALLGLMAAGEVDHPAVARGIAYLTAHAGRRRLLGRAALHRDRFPARVLSALSRLREILPALGAGALPQSEERQHAGGGVRDVSPAAPANTLVTLDNSSGGTLCRNADNYLSTYCCKSELPTECAEFLPTVAAKSQLLCLFAAIVADEMFKQRRGIMKKFSRGCHTGYANRNTRFCRGHGRAGL